MFALAKLAPRTVAQARNLHYVPSPPMNRSSLLNQLVHVGIMIGAILSVPMYVAVNFKNYRAPPEE